MAQYVRFEIYIPIEFTVTETDPSTGKKRRVRRALDDELVEQFVHHTRLKYKGITQGNPLQAAFKGWWQSKPKSAVQVDYLTYLFGLVRISQSDEARDFFTRWKRKFEKATEQKVILVVYYPVQTLGDFL